MDIWINPRLVEQSAEDFYGPVDSTPARRETVHLETPSSEEKLPFYKYVPLIPALLNLVG